MTTVASSDQYALLGGYTSAQKGLVYLSNNNGVTWSQISLPTPTSDYFVKAISVGKGG